MPGRGKDMGDGWETKRRRDPGPDWSIVKLAFEGSVAKVLLDTAHFKGNFPDRFSLEGTTASDEDVMNDKANWQAVLPEIPLQANHEHIYFNEILSAEQSFSHIRLNIFPDGGVSRLRIFGYRAIK